MEPHRASDYTAPHVLLPPGCRVTDALADVLPVWLATVVAAAVAAGLVFGFVGGAAFIFIWLERKVSGRIQDRYGPTRTGPFGLLQSLADGIKLVTKEDTTPDGADRFLFRVAPYLAFCAAFCGFIALPFSLGVVTQELSIAVLFVLAVLSSEVFGVMLAGYASGSKWSLFGGVREAAQVVSYEVPRSLCALVPICLVGTLDLVEIGRAQEGPIWNWLVFHDPFTFVAFFIFFTVVTAGCKRAPFDLAEAESELVAGFHTEYSGMRWSYFFLAEYGSMFAVSGLAALLFLGGWHTGFLPFEPRETLGLWLGTAVNLLTFTAKGAVLITVMMWLRWSLPRLRIDQVMMVCLKYFLPISCGLLLGVCVWELFLPRQAAKVVPYVLSGGTLLFGLGVFASLLRPGRFAPSVRLAGVWKTAAGKGAG